MGPKVQRKISTNPRSLKYADSDNNLALMDSHCMVGGHLSHCQTNGTENTGRAVMAINKWIQSLKIGLFVYS